MGDRPLCNISSEGETQNKQDSTIFIVVRSNLFTRYGQLSITNSLKISPNKTKFCNSEAIMHEAINGCGLITFDKVCMYHVSLKSEGVRPFFVINWPGITHMQPTLNCVHGLNLYIFCGLWLCSVAADLLVYWFHLCIIAYTLIWTCGYSWIVSWDMVYGASIHLLPFCTVLSMHHVVPFTV